ncbi:uncharacterized protein Tco025E_05814 [Trypanosoma conorhini]|uniref:Uncharacterized protein n=1 Tax=Trypanosoma conorhini TaxID=83891 RepID=A0A3R7P995_9TRYP|nr:uncharacterized protein Tco025E_05814 [Trypanosoma conorhini]RNF14890.1 hypothetical protein Tco025E_05814 [Trypanosoma conorhini]
MRRNELREFLRGREEENERARDAVLDALREEYKELLASKLAAITWQVEQHCRGAAASRAAPAAPSPAPAEDVGPGARAAVVRHRCRKVAPLPCVFPEQSATAMSPNPQQSAALRRRGLARHAVVATGAEVLAEARGPSKTGGATRTQNPPAAAAADRPTAHDSQRTPTELSASRTRAVSAAGNDEEGEGWETDAGDDRAATALAAPPPREASPCSSPRTDAAWPPDTCARSPEAAATTLARAPAVQLRKMPTDEIIKAQLKSKIAALYNDAVDTRRPCSPKGGGVGS